MLFWRQFATTARSLWLPGKGIGPNPIRFRLISEGIRKIRRARKSSFLGQSLNCGEMPTANLRELFPEI